MPPWFLPALGASLCVAVHYALLRAASGRIGDTLGALVLEGSAALGLLVAYLFAPRGEPVETTRAGVVFAALSGCAICGVSILLFMTLRRGGPVSTTGTLVMGGGVTLSALAAPWLFGEAVTLRRVVGVGLGVAAMLVLSRDPGTNP